METATLYPRAASRSWMEINVRPWLAVTLLMVIGLVLVSVLQWRDALRVRRLIEHNVTVKGVVTNINGRARTAPRDELQQVDMKYPHPTTQQPLLAPGMLSRKPGQSVSLGDVIELRIDPQDPMIWTDLASAPPVARELIVPLVVLLPMVLLCLAIAVLQRARVRKTLRTGTLTQATVVSVKNSPLAPLSKQIGLATGAPGARVRHAYWPTRNGPVVQGDLVEVVASETMVLPVRSYR